MSYVHKKKKKKYPCEDNLSLPILINSYISPRNKKFNRKIIFTTKMMKSSLEIANLIKKSVKFDIVLSTYQLPTLFLIPLKFTLKSMLKS